MAEREEEVGEERRVKVVGGSRKEVAEGRRKRRKSFRSEFMLLKGLEEEEEARLIVDELAIGWTRRTFIIIYYSKTFYGTLKN